jgi:uncharacterized protein (TIGR00730 family)
LSADPVNQQRDTINREQLEASRHAVEQAVLDLCKVVDSLSTVSSERQEHYRVTIFGSARLTPDHPIYSDVRRLAAELAAMGCDIVTGGGPGLMQAANEGESIGDRQHRTRSYGLRIDLAFEQATNPYVEHMYQHGTFFSRLHHFVHMSSAYVVVPGGIGTTLELMLVWQLLQVRKLHGTPLILVGTMWRGLVEWAKEKMTSTIPLLADQKDVEIPQYVETIDQAIALIREDYVRWERSAPVQ